MSQFPDTFPGTAPGCCVGSEDIVSTSPPTFSGDRARAPQKLENNGTRDKGSNTSAGWHFILAVANR